MSNGGCDHAHSWHAPHQKPDEAGQPRHIHDGGEEEEEEEDEEEEEEKEEEVVVVVVVVLHTRLLVSHGCL